MPPPIATLLEDELLTDEDVLGAELLVATDELVDTELLERGADVEVENEDEELMQ